MQQYHLKKCTKDFSEKIYLASSKSESNRALIINALCNNEGELLNLSAARDTQTMIRLLTENGEVADVLDAGTTMRFLTAFFTVSNLTKTMTGTPRMCQRPIGILVDALVSLGADIEYLEEVGYPPIKLNGIKNQLTQDLKIAGNVSSQYISALLMIAPLLPNGLILNIVGEIGSIPYIKMTIRQMQAFGVEVQENWDLQVLKVAPQNYIPCTYKVESDWSGASYWYSIVALSPYDNTRIELIGLHKNSLQGDSVIADIMHHLGVKSTFTADGVLLEKKAAVSEFQWDFTECPDLAQTVAVVLVAKEIPAFFTGIESLKIKETDRVLALQNELKKLGGTFAEFEKDHKYIINTNLVKDAIPVIETYDDHRMAMAFAPYALLSDIVILEPGVVAKSYPSYWDDIKKIVEII